MSKFDIERSGTGTKEWAEHVCNIQIGCSNSCLYCYAAQNASRFKVRPRENWKYEELTAKANMSSYPKKKGVVMFPSSHDITSFNLNAYIRVAKIILEAGNQLLIVTKPDITCSQHLITELSEWKEQILFRFTIGTMGEGISAFWEPGAPRPGERLESLRMAWAAGFATSVSAEPLLGGINTAITIITSVDKYVTDTIWIGKLNKARLRVPSEFHDHVEKIEAMQTDDLIIKIHSCFKDNPKIRWKDSIKEVIERCGR